MDAAELSREAKNVSFEEMKNLIEKVIDVLKKEKREGKVGNQKIKEGLVEIEPEGYAIVIGDLHGDLDSLTYILKQSQFLKGAGKNKVYLVFLGDYGDRGEETPEVYYVVLKLKEIFPENVILLRGNHEGPQDLGVYPFDLPHFLRSRFGTNWQKLFSLFPTLFDSLYHTLLVKEKYLMLHGGLPEGISSIDDIAYARKNHPAKYYLTEILWNDPGEIEGTFSSPRGAGKIFGEDISEKILNLLKVKTLIRSHEPCEGTFPTHKGRVLTLFSRKGPPYYNLKAAYLNIDLSSPAKNAVELAKEAYYF